MISALESLSFSVHSKPGLYALLIGSGVSRSAEIPTGWAITKDLVRRLAELQGEGDAANIEPEQWYEKKFSRPPNYSALLQELAPQNATQRSIIVRKYFEPDADDLDQGSKTPQKAHIAIAELVAKGYIRAIITTNFDRLIEKALDSEGLDYTVISTPNQAKGVMPLAHENCSLIKVNGDYRDIRIRNTREELATKYPAPLARLIRQIFDEYGLIVCGWSGEYDTALLGILESSTNRRFPIFWASRGEPKERAQKFIQFKRAEMMPINDADSFFQELSDNVLALEKFARPHPLSTKVSVAKLKRYLSDPKHYIDAHDLVRGFVHDLYANLEQEKSSDGSKDSSYVDRIKFYTLQAEPLSCLLVIGCHYGDRSNYEFWASVIEKITNPPHGLFQNSDDARRIVPLILFYSAGIAAIAAKKYDLLKILFFSPKIGDTNSEEFAVLRLNPSSIINPPNKQLPLMKNGEKPRTLHDYLFDLLRSGFRDILLHDATYCKAFDRFEYLAVLVRADLSQRDEEDCWGGAGRFARNCRRSGPYNIMDEIEKEMTEARDDWAPSQAGLFDGKFSRALEVKTSADKLIRDYVRGKRDIYW